MISSAIMDFPTVIPIGRMDVRLILILIPIIAVIAGTDVELIKLVIMEHVV